MILLEDANRCVQETLESKISTVKSGGKPESVDVTVADFDGVVFHISGKAKIQISISLRCWDALKKYGAEKVIADKYGPLVSANTESNYNVTLELDLENVPDKWEEKVKEISQMKKYLLSAPFFQILNDMDEKKPPPPQPICIPYRENESIYIKPQEGSLMVWFSITFVDPDDIIFAKVFLQEFQDARRTAKQAPSVMYSAKEAPSELKALKVKEGDNIGFVTFVLFAQHIEKKNREKSIATVIKFRNYLHYHIKCGKAYLHTRMRSRVEALLLILNRARPVVDKSKVEKKTMSGRTFTRK